MSAHFFRFSGRCLMLLAGIATSGGALLAQQTAGDGLQVITVTAPRLVTKQVVGRTAGTAGGEAELISLQRRVSYVDLNLALHADVMQLEARINDAAKQSCDELAKMYPLSDPKTPDCVREAVGAAKAQLDAVVAAASKHK